MTTTAATASTFGHWRAVGNYMCRTCAVMYQHRMLSRLDV